MASMAKGRTLDRHRRRRYRRADCGGDAAPRWTRGAHLRAGARLHAPRRGHPAGAERGEGAARPRDWSRSCASWPSVRMRTEPANTIRARSHGRALLVTRSSANMAHPISTCIAAICMPPGGVGAGADRPAEPEAGRSRPERRDGVRSGFADGSRADADLVIGADGVHSVVRDSLFGAEKPIFTGRVAYRTTYPASRLGGAAIDDCAKWWGPDRHIVIYYVNPRRDEIYFVTSTPEPDFDVESWSAKGDLDMLRAAYRDFHPKVRAVLDACPEVHKWALFEREPLLRWSADRITLLGDACHPMTPYMAQGAATAIEDAAVLPRCLDGVDAGRSRPRAPALRGKPQGAHRAHPARFPASTTWRRSRRRSTASIATMPGPRRWPMPRSVRPERAERRPRGRRPPRLPSSSGW